MTKQLLFLVGMPGSGKSTEGKKLSKFLGWNFVDLDRLIENEIGSSISNIFETEGEAYFRAVEKKALHQCFELNHTVIACGGGTPCFSDNMDEINKHGISIYLKANSAFLCSRIHDNNVTRPMFKGLVEDEILQKVQNLLQTREGFYRKAQLIIELPIKDTKSLHTNILGLINP